MSFWDNVFTPPQGQQPVAPQGRAPVPVQGRAWWQDEPQRVLNQGTGQQYEEQQHGHTEAELKAIRKRGHNQISAEEAEEIAEYDLTHKPKYMNECPNCGSGNFIPAGMRMGSTIMPTDKCFNCGAGARSPEPAVGASGSRGASISTRQIDTGGGGGNMFGQLGGIPRSYMPRGG